MRTHVRVLAVLIGAVVVALAGAQFAGGAPSTTLVINEIDYDQPSTDTAEFIELKNVSGAAIDLDPYTLRLVNGANNTVYLTFELPSFSVPAGGYVVLCGNPATVAECDIDIGATSDLIQNGAPDAAALLNGTTIVDTVSYEGDVPGYTEGSGVGVLDDPAPPPATPLSISRCPDGSDTEVNSADFRTVTSTAGAANACPGAPPPTDSAPTVTATTPADGQGDVSQATTISITFSEPVTAGPNAFGLTCGGQAIAFTVTPSGSSTTFVLTPSSPLPTGAECTVTVTGSQISDVDTIDPPDNASNFSFTFTTQGQTGLRIHDIQGRQHLSPYRGLIVAAVPGIVTARRTNGFYYQDPMPDLDPRTSEGIFVFTGAAPPASVIVGAPITVSGRVSEFRGGCSPSCAPPNYDIFPFDAGSSAFGNLTTTQIDRATVTPWTSTNTISPTTVGRGGRIPPSIVIDDDTPDPQVDDPPLVSGDVEQKSSPPGVTSPQDPTFDPWEDGIDFHESLEGMLVQVNNAVAVSPTVDFSVNASRPRGTNSEIAVLADRGRDAGLRTFRGGIIVRSFDRRLPHEYRRGDFNPERLIFNDPILREQAQTAPAMDVRDTFTAPIRAIVDYSFGNFKYLMLNNAPVADGGLRPEVVRPAKKHELSVATYNVENLDPVNDAPRMSLIARQIIDNLRSPDLIALVEMQDFDGEGPGGPAGDATFAALAATIAAEGGPVYQWRQIDPVHNADGGVPNGNIRVGFLFRTDRGLAFVDRPGGTAVTPTEDNPALPGAQLTFSPGRVDPNNPVWLQSRKPLAGEFMWRGRKLFVVANHLNSKTGDQPLMGRFQEPMRPTEIQRRGKTMPVADPQRGQAGVLNAWVRRLLNADRRADVIVLGDLNDYHFSETVNVLQRGLDRQFELFNLYYFHPRPDRYSYNFQGNSQDLDHILVSPHLVKPKPDFDPVHINSEFFDQVSDHDSLVTRVKLRGGHDDDDDDDDDDDGGHDDDDDDRGDDDDD